MDIAKLQSLLSTAWVVWFFLLTVGVIAAVMRPGKRRYYEEQGLIPFRDEDPASVAGGLPLGPRA